ncbi:hypothetical protein CU098_005911, partial [Rhizopus stolonifer]
MGKLVGFYPLGMMVGLPAGGGYEAPFIASVILCGIDFFMRLVVIEKTDGTVNTESEDMAKEVTSKKKVTWLKLLRQKRLIVSLVLSTIVATPTLSMRLIQEWGFDPSGCSLILLAYMIPSIAASWVWGKMCDKIGTKLVAILALFFATPSCIVIGVPNHSTGSFWLLIPGLIFGGITIAGCQAPVFPEIAKVVDAENDESSTSDGIAKSYSLFNAAYGIGMCLGPFAGGYLYDSIGFFWLCVMLSILFFCFIPLAFLYIGDTRSLINRPKKEKRKIPRENNRQTSGLSALTLINN